MDKQLLSACRFAKENGYPDARYLQEWHGFKLFVAADNSCSGYPPYILVYDKTVRFATPEETETILFT